MDTKALLEQLLESGRKLAEQGMAHAQNSGLADKGKELAEKGKQLAEKGKDIAEQGLQKGKELAEQGVQYAQEQLPPPGPERDKMLKNLGVGAAAGGLLALLVGTKTGRKVLSPAVKLGSLAALGGIGYKVFTEWQKSQGLEVTGQPIANLMGPAANDRSMAIIKAMIGAAKADGTIDEAEHAMIVERINSSDLEKPAAEILLSELQKPLDVAAIADAADSPESAVEIYLASLLLTDKSNAAEQGYLSKLSEALKLDSKLVADLEAQAFSPA